MKEIIKKQKFYVFVIMLLLIIIAYLVIDKQLTTGKIIMNQCDDKYLDYCFDKNSENYKCNINDNTCDNWDIVRKIRFMEENNITIYGVKGCQWCEKQLEEFKKYSTYLYLTGMYVECASEFGNCQGVSETPIWKENGKIAHKGYVSLERFRINEYN